MNKFLLSTFLASGIIFSGVVKAEDSNVQSVPQAEVIKMEKTHPDFDKNFHEKMAKRMAKKLNLTEEQQEKASKIRQEGQKKIEPLMDEMKTLREKIDIERKANMEEFEKILTPEQKKIFNEMKEKGPRGAFGRHHKRGKPHLPPHSEHKK